MRGYKSGQVRDSTFLIVHFGYSGAPLLQRVLQAGDGGWGMEDGGWRMMMMKGDGGVEGLWVEDWQSAKVWNIMLPLCWEPMRTAV